jgi:hypothetical protein
MANRVTVHLSQGVRYGAQGCAILWWKWARAMNDALEHASHCLPPILGDVGGGFLDLFHLWDCIWITTEKGSLKDSFCGRRPVNSGAPLWGTDTSSHPAAKVTAKSRDKLVVRHLPAITPRTSTLVASSSGTPLQGAKSSITCKREGHCLRNWQAPPSKHKAGSMYYAEMQKGQPKVEPGQSPCRKPGYT